MSDTTPRLALTELVAAQAQKHVTVNEDLIALDALMHCRVISMSLSAPPDSPSDGDCYLVADSATGDWADYDGKIAYCLDGDWTYLTPFTGLTVYNDADGGWYRYSGSAWSLVAALGGTLTTGGAVTFSGAYASIFNVPGAYTWTLPAVTGTLAATNLDNAWSVSQTFSPLITVGDSTATTNQSVFGRGILVGNSTSLTTDKPAKLQISSSGTETSGAPYNSIGLSIIMFSDDTSDVRGGEINLCRSGSDTRNAVVALSSGMQLGGITFCGADGSDLRSWGAKIAAVCAGTVSTDVLPTDLVFYTNASASTATQRWKISYAGHFLPYATGTYNMGSSTLVIANGYIVNAWNVTSDANYKTEIVYVSATDALLYIGWALAGIVRSYKLKDAVAAKGDAARTHFGWIAQEVVAAFSTYGLDAFAYGCVGYDETWETTTVATDATGKETSRSISREEADAVTADTSGATQTTDNNGNTTTVVATTADGITTTITTVHTCRYNVRMAEINALTFAAIRAKIDGAFPTDALRA